MMYALTMMRPFSRTAIFSLIAMGTISLAPCVTAQQADRAEAARREMASRDARQLVQEARNAYKAGRYTQAVEHYRSALYTMPKSDAPADKRFVEFVKLSLSDALIARAIDYRTVGRYEEAVEFLQEALQLAPGNKRAEVELLHTKDPMRHNPALSPQHVGDVAEVNRLLELGYAQIDLAKFDEAIETFATIIKIDPYNSAARQGQELARRHKMTYYETARNAARANMLADVDKQWEESVTGGAPKDLAEGEDFVAAVDAELQSDFARRLSEMVLEHISFDEATIKDVVDVLQNQIKRFDTASNASGRSINLTTNFGNPNSDSYKKLMEQTVRLNLAAVSVKELLDILANQLGISYYYTTTGVELSYSGRDFGPLMDRTFNVPPHFFDPTAMEEKEEEELEADSFDEPEPGGRMAIRRVNPVKMLKEMGISFPEGATARYSASTRRLTVRNTSHNLAEIEELLNIPLEESRQVVLNVIAMEVSEDDLEELGFDWMFNVNVGGNHEVMGGSQIASGATGLPMFEGNPKVQHEQGGTLVTGGLRSGKQVVSAAGTAMDNLINTGSVSDFTGSSTALAPGIFGVRGVWNAVDVTLIMRGLSQKKGVDILHNPRLIFSPGAEEQVVFANVREMFFPETWEAPQTASLNGFNNNNNNNPMASGSSAAVGANPTDFVRFGMSEDGIGGIGTILQVHNAEISENGRFVTLALTTTTNEFEGFVNWGTPIDSVLWSANEEIVKLRLSPNYILQPMIKRYVENTKLTVVPGTVIVMGGLKEASVVRYEDKVPVLGDLPLVGRLFRSEGEQKKRKALIYFAKVDVVDPTGRDVATGEHPSMATQNY